MPLPHSDNRDVERRLKAVYYRQKLRSLIPAIASILGLTMLFTLSLYNNVSTWNRNDLEGAMLQEGDGVVVRLTPPYTTIHGETHPPLVRVRIDGKEADMEYRIPVRVGDRVRVTYKLGKSGRIYIAHLGAPDL